MSEPQIAGRKLLRRMADWSAEPLSRQDNPELGPRKSQLSDPQEVICVVEMVVPVRDRPTIEGTL